MKELIGMGVAIGLYTLGLFIYYQVRFYLWKRKQLKALFAKWESYL